MWIHLLACVAVSVTYGWLLDWVARYGSRRDVGRLLFLHAACLMFLATFIHCTL